MPTAFLFVDDDTALLKVIARMVRKEAIEPVFLDDPRAALDRCRRQGFDVVLSDFMMPSMNGVELLRSVRTLLPSTTRMLLTGYAESPVIAAATLDGTVQRVLEKPFRLEYLLEAVRSAAAAASRREQLTG